MLSDSTILKHIARQPRRAAGFKQLVRELGLHGGARRELDNRLQKLVARGDLLLVDSDRYALPLAGEKDLVAGRLTMHRDGFGFVIADASTLPPDLKSRMVGDIFIPPHLMGNAMHGDRVLVDHAVQALIVVLEPREVADRAEVVAEVEVAGGLHPGKDPAF